MRAVNANSYFQAGGVCEQYGIPQYAHSFRDAHCTQIPARSDPSLKDLVNFGEDPPGAG